MRSTLRSRGALRKKSGGRGDGFDDHDFAVDLERAAIGNMGAVQRLVSEFEPGLVDFARRKGAADPEGVVNAALSDALRGLPTFRGRDRRAFRAYLYQILRRRIVDEIRRECSQPKTVAGLDGQLAAELIDHRASTFDDRFADRELVDEILDQLTDEQREVLELRLLNGLSIRETATKTGRSEVAVKAMQHRALTSLRSVVIAVAVLVLAVVGIRLLIALNQEVITVENGPASTSSDTPDLNDGISEENSPEEHSQGAEVSVLEAKLPDEPPSAPSSSTAPTTPAQNPNPITTAPAVAPSTTPPPSSSPPTTTAPGSAAPAAMSVCSVVTDGTPAKGEVAFVTYHFDGPYELFRGTSVDVLGPQGASALIAGKASPARAWNNQRFAFVISGNMLRDDGLRVQTLLGGDQVKTDCAISDDVAPRPCRIKTDGSPTVGEEATVRYRPYDTYWTLESGPTYVIAANRESAFKSGGTAVFEKDSVHTFLIDKSMLSDGALTIRTAFEGGKGHADCEVL